MKLVLAEPRLLKDSIGVISELVNEVTIHIGKNALEITAMDPANVAMTNFKFLSSAFVEYNVAEESKVSLSLEAFNQILKRAKPSDTMTLELEPKKNQFVIKLKGESTRTFKLGLLDMDQREQKQLDLKFNTKVEMPAPVFYEAIDDMGIVAESVNFKASKDSFLIEAESKLNAAHVEISTDDETSIVTDKDTHSKYSLEYLKKIVKGSRLAENVTLQFGDEYPLRVDFKVLDKLSMSFILAPRVVES